MSTVSTIDLSSLPAPGIIEELDFEVILRAMRDDLVAEEVEVDPLVAAPTDSAPDDVAVELLGCGEIIDRECEMERTHRADHGHAFHLMLQPMLGCCSSIRSPRRAAAMAARRSSPVSSTPLSGRLPSSRPR